MNTVPLVRHWECSLLMKDFLIFFLKSLNKAEFAMAWVALIVGVLLVLAKFVAVFFL